MHMGIRVGVHFEGIKCMFDGLLDMQRFLSRVSKVPVELASHAQTRPLLPSQVPSNPYLYSPTTLSTRPPYSPSHCPLLASQGRHHVYPRGLHKLCVRIKCEQHW